MPFQDITQNFTAAANALPLGELVKDEFFTLAESVGALEIMDPKMDSGLLEAGESLEPDYDVARSLAPEEVIGLMDQLLCFEAAWHQGNPLAQTIFTCLYIDKLLWPIPKALADVGFKTKRKGSGPNDLVDIVLKAYCCGLVKSCDFVHSQITKEQYYEDEDFSAHLYNRQLLNSVPANEIQGELDRAQEFVTGMSYLAGPVQEALIERLQFRSLLLGALSRNPVRDAADFCSKFQHCRKTLSKIKASSELGKPVPDAFSAKVQRKLVSSTPPRPVVETTLGEAFKVFDYLCTNAQDATDVLQCTTAANVVNFLLAFMSRDPQPSVYVRCLVQTLIYTEGAFLGRFSAQQFIFDDLDGLVLGQNTLTDPANSEAEAPQSARYHIARNMHQFAASTAQAFTDLARCLCMNRSRTRRLMGTTLNDWENLQFEAEDVDGRLQAHTGESPLIDRLSPAREKLWSFPLSSWVYVYKLRQMEWIVQLGFELAVYLPDELPAMFWYLRYLTDVRLQHLNRILTFTSRAYGLFDAPSEATSLAFRRTIAALEYAKDEANATICFAECLSYLCRGLLVLGLLRLPPRPYSEQRLRHSLRMKPFLPISLPPVPSADELETAIETGVRLLSTAGSGSNGTTKGSKDRKTSFLKAASLLDMAEESSLAARKGWDALVKHAAEPAQVAGCEVAWRRKNRDVLKSVIATGIAIVETKKAALKAQESSSGSISGIEVHIPERGYHEWWPVPSIKSV